MNKDMNKRIVSLDLIKGIAMVMIILVHYNLGYTNATNYYFAFFQMGCPIFFVASGVGISILLKKRYNTLNSDNLKSFYGSRIKVLAPGWYLCIVVSLLLNLFSKKVLHYVLSIGINSDPISIIINLLFLNGIVPSANNMIAGGWYIGATVILYLLAPFMYKLLNRERAGRIAFFAISSALSLLLLLLMYKYFYETFSYENFGYFSFLNHYPSFCLGMMLGFDIDNESSSSKNKLYGIIGLILFVLAVKLWLSPIRMHNYVVNWVVAISAYFIIYALTNYEKKHDISSNKLITLFTKFGRNSYYIFLFHPFTARLSIRLLCATLAKNNIYIDNMFYYAILMIPAIALSYFAGWITRKFIEQCTKLISSKKE